MKTTGAESYEDLVNDRQKLLALLNSLTSPVFALNNDGKIYLYNTAAQELVGIKSGSSNPNTKKIGTVTVAQLEEIAKIKMEDLNAANLEAAVKTIAGSARSMGLNVEGL